MSAVQIDEPEKFEFPPLIKMVCLGMVGVGVVTTGLLALFGGKDVALGGWLIGAWYALGFALFGGFLLALNHLTNACWHVTLKRIPEAFTGYLPVALLTMLVMLLGLVGAEPFYEWAHLHATDGVVNPDLHAQLLAGKAWWLTKGMFAGRMLLFFALWIGLTTMLVRHSRKQDEDGCISHTFAARKWSAIYCIVFGLSLTAASVDYIMAIEATWFSTMFGVYQFSGIFQSGIAMLAIFIIILKKHGYYKTAINDEHIHTLGIWLMAFCLFWGYIWFSQFMLIWYASIPEETQHYYARWENSWFWISFVANPLINFVIPFLLLMPRPNKRSLKIVGIAACIVLFGRFIDLWQFVMPQPELVLVDGEMLPTPTNGLETFFAIGTTVGFFGLFGFFALKALEKAPLLAKKDPFFEESVNLHL